MDMTKSIQVFRTLPVMNMVESTFEAQITPYDLGWIQSSISATNNAKHIFPIIKLQMFIRFWKSISNKYFIQGVSRTKQRDPIFYWTQSFIKLKDEPSE